MRIRHSLRTLVILLQVTLLGGQALAAADWEYKKQAGPYAVRTLQAEWKDAQRERTVPVKIYYPDEKEKKGSFPVVIFSHGLGGSRDGYEYLGRHWASYGYISVHLQHEGSDSGVWKGKKNASQEMAKAAKDPQNAINRPLDVSFAIDALTKMNAEKDGPLAGRLNLEEIAVAGHSFGAFTALAIAGEVGQRAQADRPFADPRVKAAIPMSSPVPARRPNQDKAFGDIAIPCLHMTGTLDESAIGETKAEHRRIPYDHIDKADQYLITFVGGDHAVFSGRPRVGRGGEKDGLFHDLIRQSTTAFLDAYLGHDKKAREWLTAKGMKQCMGTNAKIEMKFPKQTSQPGPEPAQGRP